MRVLMGLDGLDQRGPAPDLDEVYAVPRTPWLRANMISTLDGAATGSDGRSGSIGNPADRLVYDTLRRLADAIVVGAGTARAEEYGPADVPIVVVSRRAEVPPLLRGAAPGRVLLATCASSEGIAAARELLGDEHVLVCGQHRVDLRLLRGRLVARGWSSLLAEGGPHLLRDLLDQGVVDELCATIVPRLVGGEHPGITVGPPVDVPLVLTSLLEADGTLLGRWQTS
ncbi:dihydrofolate reductase family protein [Nocardioides sp. W7]|uniref:dihydrofolate reductase family protein n=1 Tax=Nocardioides sp. W7 TaxID=2931390 RepID=UPI001FD5E671|nr:dihydrofolate reductase family protein [Nocardioides sp. W7]